MHNRIRKILLALMVNISLIDVTNAEFELSGRVGFELRTWMDGSSLPGQNDHGINPSLLLQPELRYEWNESNDFIQFMPYLRLDAFDENRRFFDIRELFWRHRGDTWDFRFGVGQVFWGVAESRHLVNIVNQVDTVEDIDEEDRLGQPMVNFTAYMDQWGTLDLFALPGFRERRYSNRRGRLRLSAIPVEQNTEVFESSLEEAHVDFAARWSHVIDEWDIALSHFYGTSREARFVPRFNNFGQPVSLVPHYDIINQTALELQWTRGSWLLKLEAITRSGHDRRLNALVGGFEYTFSGVFNTDMDVGVLAEYLWDDRSQFAPLTPLDDDLFAGLRFALNDVNNTEMLIGAIVDRHTGASIISVEAQRRVFESWRISLDARLFLNVPRNDRALFALKDDSFVNVSLAYYF
ncbi:MAG: hypothetical protein ABFS02_04200 [Pseudomonadota bacterium]